MADHRRHATERCYHEHGAARGSTALMSLPRSLGGRGGGEGELDQLTPTLTVTLTLTLTLTQS